ncbi:MAG: hypothetical protein NVS2B9_05450 [Myxococcales bacterium]
MVSRASFRRLCSYAALALLALACATAGCARDKPPAGAVGAAASTVVPAANLLAAGAQPGRSDPACAAPIESPQARVLLRQARGEVKVGILAGLKDSDDANLSHLRALAGELVRRGAEVLIADGDLGDHGDAQAALLGVLTATGLPVLAVAGNRESRGELDAVEADLRRRGARIIDLSRSRIVDLGDALVVGLAGTFDRRQAREEGACVYVQRDVDAVAAALEKLASGPAPAILVAAVPPRGNGLSALDVSEGQNTGDPRLTPLLRAKRAPFGVFGQVWEAGGRAIDGAGKPVAPLVFSEQLYVNPGAADHTPWPMSDGTTQKGLAALLTVRGRKAAVEFVRAPAPPPLPAPEPQPAAQAEP